MRNLIGGGIGMSRFFAEVGDSAQAIGDITPGYFSHPDVPERLLKVLGSDIDLFLIERDPVERAFSEYRGMLRRGETTESFETALGQCERLVNNSSYALQTQRYIDRFGANRIHVIEYADIAANPESVIENVCQVLGVPAIKTADLHARVNEGTAPPKYRGLRRRISCVREGIERNRIGRRLLWSIRRTGLISRFHQATSTSAASNQDMTQIDWEHCRSLFASDQAQWATLRQQLGS